MEMRLEKPFSVALLAVLAATSAIPVSLLRADAAQTPAQFSGDDVIAHLSAMIAWYRDLTTNVPPTGLPVDSIYRENAESLAADAVRLGFQSARAEAPLMSTGDKPSNPGTNPSDSGSGVSQSVSRVQAHIAQLQSQIGALDKQIASASARNKKALTAQRDNLQGPLELSQAVLDALLKLADSSENTGGGAGTGLLSNINRLAQTIPEVLGRSPTPSTAPATATAQTASAKAASNNAAAAGSGGLAAQALALYSIVRTVHQIDLLVNETDAVRAAASQVRKPLRDALRAIAQQAGISVGVTTGTAPVGQSAEKTAGPSTAQAPPADFDALTRQFKQLSGAAIPLSQEIILLDQSKMNLLEWRRTIVRESGTSFRALSFHIALIGGALAIVLIFSEVWRRFTFRYIKDARRRRQFLVVRRFVIGFLMGVILILGFVSQFSSLVTFAGFVTAGIAVGLQAVLLSVAAYFFLIGRWGIRVGDRVSVSGVTGDVIDVGLVRFYMMELAGTGIDLYQTGRIVVFPNSVLFQSATPLFKQIPGTEYALHEVAVSLAAGANHKAVQEWLTTTVNSVYTRYRGEIERQIGAIEDRIDMRLTIPATEPRLQFADTGLEFLVRYPVEIRRSAEIDEEVTRAVLESMEKDASLKNSLLGLPKIRAAVRG